MAMSRSLSVGRAYITGKADGWAKQRVLPISPLEGEMSGRTEGGI
ncbi:hypothetical protein J2857_000905 [Neorhizobium galegae]|nr:hypothetical protein [Neorhizobium galegae]